MARHAVAAHAARAAESRPRPRLRLCCQARVDRPPPCTRAAPPTRAAPRPRSQSLPVAFGIDKAKWICVASIDVTQLAVAAYLYAIGETTFALVLTGLVLPQMF